MSEFSIDSLFKIIEEQVDKDIRQFTDDVKTEISTLQLQGLSDEDILDRLVISYKEQSGVFKKLIGNLGSRVDYGLFSAANLNATQQIAIATGADKYEWIEEPAAEHCDTCTDRAGEKKTYDEWMTIGLPGQFFKQGQIGTECGHYCKCLLIPAI